MSDSAQVVIWTRELAKLREKAGDRTSTFSDQPKLEASGRTSKGLVQAFGLGSKRVLNPPVALPCSDASVSMVVDYFSA